MPRPKIPPATAATASPRMMMAFSNVTESKITKSTLEDTLDQDVIDSATGTAFGNLAYPTRRLQQYHCNMA